MNDIHVNKDWDVVSGDEMCRQLRRLFRDCVLRPCADLTASDAVQVLGVRLRLQAGAPVLVDGLGDDTAVCGLLSIAAGTLGCRLVEVLAEDLTVAAWEETLESIRVDRDPALLWLHCESRELAPRTAALLRLALLRPSPSYPENGRRYVAGSIRCAAAAGLLLPLDLHDAVIPAAFSARVDSAVIAGLQRLDARGRRRGR